LSYDNVNMLTKHVFLLGSYNTIDSPITIVVVSPPITIVVVSLINIVVPLLSPIVITVPHRIPLLFILCLYIIIVRSAWLYCDPIDSYI